MLVGVTAYLPHLVTVYQRWQQEQEWQRLDDECAKHRLLSCGLLASRVGPACVREDKSNACYHLAVLLERGIGVAKNARQVTAYYQKACEAGIRAACAKVPQTP